MLGLGLGLGLWRNVALHVFTYTLHYRKIEIEQWTKIGYEAQILW